MTDSPTSSAEDQPAVASSGVLSDKLHRLGQTVQNVGLWVEAGVMLVFTGGGLVDLPGDSPVSGKTFTEMTSDEWKRYCKWVNHRKLIRRRICYIMERFSS